MIKPIVKFTSLLLLGSMLVYSTPFLNTTGAYASASSTPTALEQPQAQDPKALVQLSGPALTSVGDNFNVTVTLTGVTGDATAGKFIFEYDPTQFDYISAEAASSAVSVAGVNAETGKVTIVTTDTTGSLTTVGSILTLTFKAKAATDLSGISGTVELGIDDGSTVQTPEGSLDVQISDAAEGDLNANSVIDVGDLSILIKYFGIRSDDPNWSKVASGDFNKDNTIDLQDLATLGKKVLYDNGQPFQLMETDIMSIQNAMAAGKLTSEQLVQMYLDRINEYDDDINSLITINPDALATAKALDDERKEKGPRGLMHGIPIIVKDNYDTLGMPTSAGCTCLKDNQTVSDAFMIKKLKDAGAIILAKANLSEFAINTDTNSSLGGQTWNPYDLKKNPGGSSGGTGASLASNFAVAGLGTDTGGSIRIPSSWNSVVGIRPTIGLTSRDGIIPLALSQDVGGPMARTVADAAVLLDAVSGYDPNDIVTAGSFGKKPVSYTKFLDKNGLKGARIGLVLDSTVVGTNQETLGLLNNAAQDMRDQGATVIGVNIPSVADIMKYPSLSGYEFKFNLNDYLSNPRMVDPAVVRYHSLTDIINSGTDFLSSLKSTLTTRNAVESLDTQEYKDIVLFRTRLTQQSLLSLMANNDLDAILYLSTTGPAGSSSGNANRLSPFSGFPAISVPAGYVSSGLPVGIELLGRPYEEGELIKLGYAYEQATHHRVAPSSVPALTGK
ncbi:amidase family protein [Paenibacillus glycanilyticus]|uniref:amidase family protein n=1 Tax=Paenibacillus glycanilyticus TaxID=126569 RepID=UPI002041AE6F|nr:amidase family protein [Paenibacillus glycanilyticus]MCM3630219.1 amidase family protein [Paenibacillus glycanilyticus]